ncbi:FliH/SctL family protein [Arthrobacter sp. zg-Y1143]|uniref:FliH/SctL family protein n=1 Tax=Arthrobacter sp. zg-Y1143 TaxID=3049065 RepID=UPI0024C2B4B8|nr:FliH/SctL family protein [Arthrobacter sp. zg-Y1143]MDK1328771.1 FliH/SctL family protein [Arthrobacter sp. zg-Y1143]
MSTETFSRLVYTALGAADEDQLNAQVEARGHAAGYAAGLRAAAADTELLRRTLQEQYEDEMRRGQERVNRSLAALNAAVFSLEGRTVALMTEMQDTLATAAMDLAEALLRRELANDDASARSALARALEGVDTDLVQRVRMHPVDLAALDEDTLRRARVDFVGDPSLPRGDAVTEFPDGYLDASLSSAVERARAALLEDRS